MIDETNPIFTPEQISEQAQGNVNYLCLAMITYLKKNAQPFDEFWAYVGQRFAPTWEPGASAKEVAIAAALNMVSAGCKLHSVSGDESQAKATLMEWPPEEGSLEFFELTQEEADSLWGIFGPIAESVGYNYAWDRQGDEVTMTFTAK